jgi:hypothetical protein
VDKKRVLIALLLVGLLLGCVVVIAYASSCNFVGSKSSDVYHYPDCRYAKNIKSGNRVCFDTPEDAVAAGYRPYKVCKPPSKSPPTPTPTPAPTPTPTPTPIPMEWVVKADTPEAGGYGEAVVSADDYIYIARCMYATSTPYFWRYNLTANSWDPMNTSGLPTGAFRSGTSLTWDNGSYIYALLGGRYSDKDRCLFYRYNIPNDSWEQLNDTPFAQGAGDSLAWSGYDEQLFAFLGSGKLGTNFSCYNLSNSSWDTALPFNWTSTDDGASLVWAGGEYLYALRGEWQETVPNGDFARYSIPDGTWADMSPMPESEGVGDGASLLWTEKYQDYIFSLGGGSCLEDPGYNFYCYIISCDEWQGLKSIPCPVGYYVGNRLGFANGHIYYWQGTPTSEKWICNGAAFYMFETTPPVLTGSTTVSSSPSAATIYLDGSYKGITPLTITEVSPGYHTIKLSLDGYNDWSTSVEVTEGKTSNVCKTMEKVPSPIGNIVINEIESNPPGNDNSNSVIEWVELYNPTSEAVDLSGWILKTTHGRIGKVYPSGTIEAKGYLVFGKGSQWLDNEGDSVFLRDNGGAKIDEVAFTDTENDDHTKQRYPNGEDSWGFRWKTKGYSNGG